MTSFQPRTVLPTLVAVTALLVSLTALVVALLR
jgi:hypothetical protein